MSGASYGYAYDATYASVSYHYANPVDGYQSYALYDASSGYYLDRHYGFLYYGLRSSSTFYYVATYRSDGVSSVSYGYDLLSYNQGQFSVDDERHVDSSYSNSGYGVYVNTESVFVETYHLGDRSSYYGDNTGQFYAGAIDYEPISSSTDYRNGNYGTAYTSYYSATEPNGPYYSVHPT